MTALLRARSNALSTLAQRETAPAAAEFHSSSSPIPDGVGHPIGDPLAGTAHREVPVGRADIPSQTQTVVLSIASSARPSLSGEQDMGASASPPGCRGFATEPHSVSALSGFHPLRGVRHADFR